ncbi:MAG TPA: hypothetical protein VMF90_08195 [Rhizobiaceae bacterium]|nr:hypothetical protein [Rhizobiaceae bacterium]
MPKSIDTAPKDGRIVRVQWRDRDGVENTSLAQYRATGPDGGPFGAGWWTYVDSDTMKRIDPHSWVGEEDEDEDQ